MLHHDISVEHISEFNFSRKEKYLSSLSLQSHTHTHTLTYTLTHTHTHSHTHSHSHSHSHTHTLTHTLTHSHSHSHTHPHTHTEEFTLSEVVRVCPICQHSDMVVRRKKDGGFMLSCLGYPECRAVQFFPPCVLHAKPDSSLCSSVRYNGACVHCRVVRDALPPPYLWEIKPPPQCAKTALSLPPLPPPPLRCAQCQPAPVHCLSLQFKPGSVPAVVPRQMTACSTCDQTLLQDLQFHGIRVTQPNPSHSGTGTCKPTTNKRQAKTEG